MLRIIHTGRAYEVLDDSKYFRAKYGALMYTFEVLNAKHAVLELRYRQQQQLNDVLGKACRSVGHLKELLENTEQKLRATKLRLESCQKSTLESHKPQDPR